MSPTTLATLSTAILPPGLRGATPLLAIVWVASLGPADAFRPLAGFVTALLGLMLVRSRREVDRPVGWLALAASAVAIAGPPHEATGARLLWLCTGIWLYVLVCAELCSEKRLWIGAWTISAVGLATALLGAGLADWSLRARLWPGDVLSGPLLDWAGLSGGLHPDKLGAALAVVLPLPLAIWLFTPGLWLRLFWFAAVAIVATVLIATQSPSALAAACCGVGLLAAARRPAWAGSAGSLPLAAGLASLVPFAAIASGFPVSDAPDGPTRAEIWGAALRLLAERPLLGVGFGAFQDAAARLGPAWAEVPHAHNLLLQIGLDLGLPGLLAFFGLLLATARAALFAFRAAPTARSRGLAAGAACGLAAYLAFGLTDAIGLGEKVGVAFWLFVGAVAAAARVAASTPRVVVEPRHAIRGVVYVSSFEWDYHIARPQQLARALASELPVLYVETTGLRGVGPRDLRRLLRRVRRWLAGRQLVEPNLWVFSPMALPFPASRLARAINRLMLRDAIRGQMRDLRLEDTLLLIAVPTWAGVDLVGALGEKVSLYDAMDDLTVIPAVHPSVAASESALLARVDVAVAASDEIARRRSNQRPDMEVVGQGVVAEQFTRLRRAVPLDLARLPRPRLVFVGGIDERLDFDLLDWLAATRPDWSIALIGPELYLDARARLTRPNLHLLGPRPHELLPGYLQAADACLIPYRDTPWTQACHPVKTLEYLAAGRPVVATDLAGLRPYARYVRLASGPTAFLAAIEAALGDAEPEPVTARQAFARRHAWADRAAELLRLADASAAAEAPRDAAAV